MHISLDDQDVKDAVHVATAARENRGRVDGCSPEDTEVTLRFDDIRGISAVGHIYGLTYSFFEQDVRDAVALYLSSYYTVDPECIEIQLSYDATTNEFGAEVAVLK